MALVALDGFEEGPDHVSVPGDAGGVSLMRRGGRLLPGGQTYSFGASRTGGGPALAVYRGGDSARTGDWGGLLMGGARAGMGLSPGEGMGYSFRRGDYWLTESEAAARPFSDTTGFSAAALITWSAAKAPWSGGVSIVINFGELTITSHWDHDEDSDSQTTAVSVPTPDIPEPGNIAHHPDWLEFSVSLSGGWFVRIADGATLASGPFPKGPGDIDARGMAFGAGVNSNPGATHTDSQLNPRLSLDDIYGWPGEFLIDKPAVRMFPRDDGRGMSSAPRIWPAPKSQRVIGGHQ